MVETITSFLHKKEQITQLKPYMVALEFYNFAYGQTETKFIHVLLQLRNPILSFCWQSLRNLNQSRKWSLFQWFVPRGEKKLNNSLKSTSSKQFSLILDLGVKIYWLNQRCWGCFFEKQVWFNLVWFDN